ncbi:MAG: DUF3231 family protein [Desulfotomaculales bacterium]
MVQIGNFHLGKAETAKAPLLDTAEAFLLWDHLLSRYDAIEKTQIYQNFAHDPDLKLLLAKGLSATLEKQVNSLEAEMNTFGLPMPSRPPKSVRIETNSGVFEDRFIFKEVFTGIQNFLDNHIRTIRSFVTNDQLRKTFIDFAKEELELYDKFVKYGKLKGWLQTPPLLYTS